MLRKNATPHAQEQTAHDVTEILLARIDSLMKREKQKIDEACLNIGRRYVQLHSADYEESFGDQMRAIAVSNEAIAGYDMQVLLITGAATGLAGGLHSPYKGLLPAAPKRCSKYLSFARNTPPLLK